MCVCLRAFGGGGGVVLSSPVFATIIFTLVCGKLVKFVVAFNSSELGLDWILPHA